MKELPKELTVELLGLVLGIKLDTVDITSAYANVEIGIVYTRQEENYKLKDVINIDTLTRLMKEWCYRKQIPLLSGKRNSYNSWCCFIDDISYKIDTQYGNTEFEAVLKATHWVATEKDLI